MFQLNKISEKYMTLAIIEFMIILAAVATYLSYQNNTIIAYGDAESHLNIAKRVVHSLTPGAAQLGGIWLPLPHILLLPFVFFEFLWRSGVAGSIVSGISYVISGLFLYKLIYLITRNRIGGLVAAAVFALNPNVMYLQSTPMTELPLIMFFILSIYFFSKFLYDREDYIALSSGAFFTLCATLTRYDGWLLAAVQALIILLIHVQDLRHAQSRKKVEAYLLLYATVAFVGVGFWLLWDYLILGDAFYFTNSPFSAKSQQQGWLLRGELPAYHNLPLSFTYYSVTAYENIGSIISIVAVGGLLFYLFRSIFKRENVWIPFILFTPLYFYVITLFMGQSVIFIPQLTPKNFSWNLFNVRYGVMMVPVAAFFVGYCFARSKSWFAYALLSILLICGIMEGNLPNSKMPISQADGVYGLSHSDSPDAEKWLKSNYDSGTVLLDDYARTLSIIRSGLPIEKVIYIGNKPYWEESLVNPELHVDWIIMQEKDSVWKSLYESNEKQGHLFKYYSKAYTSPNIMIFKRIFQ